jgi:hypothetical protein
MILENAVDGFVGANSFARTTGYVRMNSHLRKLHNPLEFQNIFRQLRFLGLKYLWVGLDAVFCAVTRRFHQITSGYAIQLLTRPTDNC